MPYPMHILVNDFAIRSFRETADKDYIAARMAYRARLIQPFLWSALHCLETVSYTHLDGYKRQLHVFGELERMKQLLDSS